MLKNRRVAILALALAPVLAVTVAAQQKPNSKGERANPTSVVSFPGESVSRARSPDGKWALVSGQPDDSGQRRLWIESTNPAGRRPVRAFSRVVRVSWAPDSQLFFVNDEWGSNGTDCYVFDAVTLKATAIANLLARRYPKIISGHKKASHLYFEASRWASSRVLLVRLTGHFDEPPAQSFTLRFEVDLNDGSIREVGESQKEEHR
jgi:hypothetical protein